MRASPIGQQLNIYQVFTHTELEAVTKDRYTMKQISSLSKEILRHIPEALQKGVTSITTEIRVDDATLLLCIQGLIMKKYAVAVVRDRACHLTCHWSANSPLIHQLRTY